MLFQIIFLIILILLNAYFAASEMAYISLNDAKIEKEAKEGNKKAKKIKKMLKNPSKFLATIQIGITLAGFLSSAFAADTFASELSPILNEWMPGPGIGFWQALSIIVITIILSFFTLIFGELVPKRLAMKYSEKIAFSTIGIISFISVITSPFVKLLTATTNLVSKIFGVSEYEEEVVTEEEIKMMVDQGQEKGVIKKNEKDLINNVSSNNTENIQKVRIEERDAYRSALASKTEAHKYYRIEHITEESVREEFEKQQQENRDNFNDEAYAITTDITDDYIDNANRITEVDETSVAMIAALRRAERRGDDIAAKALRKLDIKGINSYRSKDIKDNRRNIYHILSDYISSYADMIDKQMKHYVIDDKEYNIGEPDLYEILRSNPDEVPNIVKLLLEAITFGDTFGNIMNLPIDGMDEDTKRYIQKIRDSINKIRNSSIIKQGFDNMFNKYIENLKSEIIKETRKFN